MDESTVCTNEYLNKKVVQENYEQILKLRGDIYKHVYVESLEDPLEFLNDLINRGRYILWIYIVGISTPSIKQAVFKDIVKLCICRSSMILESRSLILGIPYSWVKDNIYKECMDLIHISGDDYEIYRSAIELLLYFSYEDAVGFVHECCNSNIAEISVIGKEFHLELELFKK